MPEFISNWRRAFGIYLLILAAVCITWWIRSHFVFDRISFAVGARQHELTSIGGHTWWCSWEPITIPTAWSSSRKPLSARKVMDLTSSIHGEYRHMSGPWGVTHRFMKWSADDWTFTVPLTAFATCLILWPGKRERSGSLKQVAG